jgi:hypothetical protein
MDRYHAQMVARGPTLADAGDSPPAACTSSICPIEDG